MIDEVQQQQQQIARKTDIASITSTYKGGIWGLPFNRLFVLSKFGLPLQFKWNCFCTHPSQVEVPMTSRTR